MVNSSNSGPWGSSSGGSGDSSAEKDFNDFFNDFKGRVGKGFGKKKPTSWKGILLIGLAAVGLWMLTGFYRVDQGEVGVELVFGKFWGATTSSGLNYNFPTPIGEVITPRVELTRKTEVGYREQSIGIESTSGRRNIQEESLMLTTDQNIVDVEFAVFWRIADPIKYLFNIKDPEGTIKLASESAMREVIGNNVFDNIVTEEKREIGDRVAIVLQEYLDTVGTGILVARVDFQKTEPPAEVIDAFNDVQRARQDLDRLRNEAEAYRNSQIPEARGQAEKIIRDAEAYRERLIQESSGEAERFLSVYNSYKAAPDVTRSRMYFDSMSSVFKNSKKVIIDPNAGSGVVPYLPLDTLKQQ